MRNNGKCRGRYVKSIFRQFFVTFSLVPADIIDGGWGYLQFADLGMYYVHGRWYRPDLGRFISPNEKGDYLYGGDGNDAINWTWFWWGFNCQYYGDISLGFYEYHNPVQTYKCQDFNGNEFFIGQLVGRSASTFQAGLEMVGGGYIFLGGGGATIVSGGTAAEVSVPVAVGGAAVTAHGAAVLVRNALSRPPIYYAKKIGSEPNFGAGNFADNLRKIKPQPSPSHQAHHMLPQAFENFFRSKGINIHDPRWGAWWDVPEHTQKWFEYNREWEVWRDVNGNSATVQDIIQKATEMAKKYKLEWP